MRRLALTSWSVHRLLTDKTAPLDLLDLPAQLAAHGIGTLELCHFHLLSTEQPALDRLRAALDAAGVELQTLLIDTGDISHPDAARAAEERELVAGWMDVAARLGARAVRVVAGEASADDEDARARAIAQLRLLADLGETLNLRVTTENFRPLASTAASCHAILDALDGSVGLCADIGNFPAASRLSEFASVVPRAEVIHVKASYGADGALLPDDVSGCLAAAVAAGFSGPLTLVYDRPESWRGIDELAAVVRPFV